MKILFSCSFIYFLFITQTSSNRTFLEFAAIHLVHMEYADLSTSSTFAPPANNLLYIKECPVNTVLIILYCPPFV